MNLVLRLEMPEDYREVEELTKKAFWNVHTPGCEEHYLMHIMRSTPDFIKKLSYVAEVDGKIVGNIAYSRSKILWQDGSQTQTITFGPIGVLPEVQGKGVGSALIEHTAELAREMGYSAIVIYGDPAYYRRFGFVPAEAYDTANGEGFYAAPMQVLTLAEDSLKGKGGRFFESEAFSFNSDEVAKFDQDFPQMEKGYAPSQDRFLKLVSMRSKEKGAFTIE